MRMQRREIVLSVVGAAFGCQLPNAISQAIDQSGQPLTLVVPTAAGGVVDTIARLMGKHLTQSLRRPVIVENKPGATTMVATEHVAKARPDGMTLLVNYIPLILNPLLYKDGRVRYDPIKNFRPVSQLARALNSVFVTRRESPPLTFATFIERGKTSKNPLTYSTIGIGSPLHLYGAMLAKQAGISLTMVPYRGESAQLPDVIAGNTDAAFVSLAGATQYTARLTPLACTGRSRSPWLPDTPTFAEYGVAGLDIDGWYGVFAPANTPTAVVELVSAALHQALKSEREQIAAFGMEVVGGTPEEFAAVVSRTQDEWTKLIEAVDIKL